MQSKTSGKGIVQSGRWKTKPGKRPSLAGSSSALLPSAAGYVVRKETGKKDPTSGQLPPPRHTAMLLWWAELRQASTAPISNPLLF